MNGTGPDIFTHVRVLVGIVIGLGLTRVLSGVATFMQHPRQKPLSLAHLLWLGVVLLSAIHFWWFELALAQIDPWPFELFVFVLLYAFIFYLMATLLIPENIDEYASWDDYFISIDLIDTLAKGPAYLDSLGIEYPVRLSIELVLCGIAIWTRNRTFHLAFAILWLLYLISWILRFYRVLY